MGGDHFQREIDEQVEQAIRAADIAFFVLDAQTGILPHDQDLYKKLTVSGILGHLPVFAVVNKIDVDVHEAQIADFFALGLDPVLPVSAEHGRGIDDLKETALALLIDLKWKSEAAHREKLAAEAKIAQEQDEPADEAETEETQDELADESEVAETRDDSAEESEIAETQDEPAVKSKTARSRNEPIVAGGITEIPDEPPARRGPARIAVVGRPNVGKSTFVNAVLGEDRMITSSIAGTTSDSVDSLIHLNEVPYVVIDTAGIRRKNKTEQGIEVLSVVQTRKTLEQCNIALLILDGEVGISDQDEKISGLIEDVGCGVILVVNKWDTQKKNQKFTQQMAADNIRKKMAYLKYAPILFVSALREEGFEPLGELVEEVLIQRQNKITTREFTDWVRKESTIHNPRNAKFFLCHQSGRNPPTFVCHVNDPIKIHFSLSRHLVNAMRVKWGFMGNPIRLLFVKANRKSLPRKEKTPGKSQKLTGQVRKPNRLK